MFDAKIHALLRACRRERDLPDHLPRSDPAGILDFRGVVEIKEQVVVFDQIAGPFCHHNDAPGSLERG